MSSSKGSSTVINYMHHFFTNYGVGETRVDLICDNCSGQNKNKFVLWYCAWRTMHNLHHRLDLHFLITGHTKFAPRLVLRPHQAALQKYQTGLTGGWYGAGGKLWLATTPDSILQAAATDQAVPALQFYSFDTLEPGVVVPKERSDSVGTRFQLLHNADILPPIDGLLVEVPPGLDTARQTYLQDQDVL
ncbi:hypothetical protein J4Q44_G00131980 [Coregonus suidteri]|uniref:DUF7869 domain-containing protein n=1 Tax=Coregonus suidteri TaxID=861788 RepID=A0AAN8LSD1_9TELE